MYGNQSGRLDFPPHRIIYMRIVSESFGLTSLPFAVLGFDVLTTLRFGLAVGAHLPLVSVW